MQQAVVKRCQHPAFPVLEVQPAGGGCLLPELACPVQQVQAAVKHSQPWLERQAEECSKVLLSSAYSMVQLLTEGRPAARC